MARMYSRARGKSGSKKPLKKEPSKWVEYSAEEIEKLIVKIAKTGKSTSEIGMILRDQYGIPDVKAITKKSIKAILKDNKLLPELPEELKNLIKKEIKIIKHLEKNHKDAAAKRGLEITESKIKKLIKYYKRKKFLPADWKYSKEQARLIIG